MDAANNTKPDVTTVLPDLFSHAGVCQFCRTSQMVHDKSGLCRSCLKAARAGWNPAVRPVSEGATFTAEIVDGVPALVWIGQR